MTASQELLLELQRAFTDNRAGIPPGLSDPDAGTAAGELAAIAENVEALHIDRLEMRALGVSDLELSAAQRARFGADAWVTEVLLSWRFPESHGAVSSLEVPVVTDWEDGRAIFVTSQVTGGYRVPLWFLEPLSVRRAARTLVLAGDVASARRLERRARTAVATVRRTFPRWSEHLVVVAPKTPADFRAATGLSQPASRAIAAVTTKTDRSSLAGAPVHVYLNPRVYGSLGPIGGQIVLTHEAAHVALDAASTDLPLWLSEGMADYVALLGTSLPDTVLAAQIRDLVRREDLPDALPGPVEFDGSNQDIGAWYEAAWLAVRLIAETYGQPALLDFYERAATAGDADRAFRVVLGTNESAFSRAWRAELLELADAGRRTP